MSGIPGTTGHLQAAPAWKPRRPSQNPSAQGAPEAGHKSSLKGPFLVPLLLPSPSPATGAPDLRRQNALTSSSRLAWSKASLSLRPLQGGDQLQCWQRLQATVTLLLLGYGPRACPSAGTTGHCITKNRPHWAKCVLLVQLMAVTHSLLDGAHL